jgi:hypothetical protein
MYLFGAEKKYFKENELARLDEDEDEDDDDDDDDYDEADGDDE